MSIQNAWNKISDIAAQGPTALVYLGIGTAMGSYKQVTPKNNQQLPCFLNKFEGNKLIGLIDPDLEYPLKIEEHFYQEMNDPLIMVNSSMNEHGKFYFRELRNRSNTVVVIAINDSIHFEHNTYFDDEESRHYNQRVDVTISNIINLIGICLGKQTKTKLIMQNYTGAQTVNFYNSLLSIFDRDEMLANVIFDVTGRDPGCFWDITEEYPILDDSGDFYQPTFKSLMKIRNDPLFRQILIHRIDGLVYPLTSNYVIFSKDPSFELAGIDKIMNLFMIYSIEFNDTNKNRDYLLAKLLELIQTMLNDIVRSLECDPSYIDHFIQLMFNRNEFINSLAVLKFEK